MELTDAEKNIQEEARKKLAEIKDHPEIIAKGAISTVVGWGVSAVVGLALHTIVPKDTLTKKQKVQMTVAAWAIGGAVAQRASKWASEESLTSGLLCGTVRGISKQFNKTEEKTEEKSDETEKKSDGDVEEMLDEPVIPETDPS